MGGGIVVRELTKISSGGVEQIACAVEDKGDCEGWHAEAVEDEVRRGLIVKAVIRSEEVVGVGIVVEK